MTCDNHVHFDVNTLVRSAVVLAVGLPLALGVSGALNKTEVDDRSNAEVAVEQFKDELTLPCLKYAFSKPDSKAERDAKNAIDEVMGGEAIYPQVCQYVI